MQACRLIGTRIATGQPTIAALQGDAVVRPHKVSSPTHVVDAIYVYLTKHSDAADSAEGIARWWLPSMNIAASVPEVEAALERMLTLGLVRTRTLADGRVIYRAAAPSNES
jgi:hypothetical protein